jgi:hypothetical protein
VLATDICTASGLETLAARGQLRPGRCRQCVVVRSRLVCRRWLSPSTSTSPGWVIDPEDLLDHLRPLVDDDGLLSPDPLEVGGYLENVERCRRQFRGLRILSGVESAQPHIDAERARQLLDLSALDHVNGSLHTVPISEEPGALRSEPITLYRQWPAERVIGGVSG